MWGYIDKDEYQQFETTEDFILFIMEREEICYMHNGGKFDFHFLLPWVNTNEPITVINGRIVKCKIGLCEIRDSYCLTAQSLDSFRTGKIKVDYAIMEKGEREKPHNRATIEKYLKQDCIELFDMVTMFIGNYGLHLTQASAAMKIFERMRGQKFRSTAQHYSDFQKYYYGGRTEAFFAGVWKKPFKVYDIKSAYPAAMTESHPIGEGYLDTWRGCGRQFVTIKAPCIGALPFRNGDSLEFPRDGEVREIHCTGWELLEHIRQGGTFEVVECYSFSNFIDFRDYVGHFFRLKEWAENTGNKAMRFFAKIFLNALYGKFASNPLNYSEFKLIELADLDEYPLQGDWRVNEPIADGRIMVDRPLPEDKHRYFDVVVGASITGWVRAKCARVQYESKNPLYMDTDALACEVFKGDTIGNGLGEWGEEAECTEAYIAGKKLYAFKKTDGKYKTASKGAKLEADEIIHIALGNSVYYENTAPTFSVSRKPVYINRTLRSTKSNVSTENRC